MSYVTDTQFVRQKQQEEEYVHEMDNVSYVHPDQDEINRNEAKTIWRNVPTNVKQKSGFFNRISMIGR